MAGWALPSVGAAQTLELTSEPATATIYRVRALDNTLIPIGVGSARLKLERNDPNTVVVKQEGFREVRRSFFREAPYPDKRFTLTLTKRLVQITALPYDATVFVNGEARGQRSVEVEVDTNASVTIEVRKPGFAPTKRVYRWDRKNAELPPASERIELQDRRIALTAPPGAEILSGENVLGTGDAFLVVPRGSCTAVRVQKSGYVPTDRQYCNKEEMPDTPITDRIELQGRVVAVTASPSARIFVNQKQVAMGSFPVRIPDGGCVKVAVAQEGYLGWEQQYCADAPGAALPLEQNVELSVDDAFSASTASEQANKNITVEVNLKLTEAAAWKLLSSIVLSHFDILENSDSQTGYLRTAWVKKSWTSGRVVRTRLIVKRTSDSPVRYAVKIVSEVNKNVLASSSDDENFEEWNRLLNVYKDVLAEIQARLN